LRALVAQCLGSLGAGPHERQAAPAALHRGDAPGGFCYSRIIWPSDSTRCAIGTQMAGNRASSEGIGQHHRPIDRRFGLWCDPRSMLDGNSLLTRPTHERIQL
jgi:hypothetical protein